MQAPEAGFELDGVVARAVDLLGGEEVLRAHVEHHGRFHEDALRALMRDFARMAHPKAVELATG